MSFNVDKCQINVINNMQSNYNMSNQQLPTTDQPQDLGISITKELEWQKQTDNFFFHESMNSFIVIMLSGINDYSLDKTLI